MATIKDALAYLLRNYPLKDEMSNARATKLVYLADWHHSLTTERQVTPIRWYFDNFGPFVPDVKTTAEENPHLFSIDDTLNMFGSRKSLLALRSDEYISTLTSDEKASLDFVIEKTKKLYWDSFIRLVYSTHPIASSERYTFLNLVQKAAEYKARKQVAL